MLRVGDELITLIDPDAPASEAYRTLRTNILMRNFDRDMKVINIISTTAQEGKSTCVLNLADAHDSHYGSCVLCLSGMVLPYRVPVGFVYTIVDGDGIFC